MKISFDSLPTSPRDPENPPSRSDRRGRRGRRDRRGRRGRKDPSDRGNRGNRCLEFRDRKLRLESRRVRCLRRQESRCLRDRRDQGNRRTGETRETGTSAADSSRKTTASKTREIAEFAVSCSDDDAGNGGCTEERWRFRVVTERESAVWNCFQQTLTKVQRLVVFRNRCLDNSTTVQKNQVQVPANCTDPLVLILFR